MIWLTKLKTLWSKGKYWISLALVGVIVLFLILVLKKKDFGWSIIQKIKDKHAKEMDIIQDSHRESSEKKEKEKKKYDKIITEINKRHKEKNEELDESHKKELKRLLKKYKNDPDALSRKLAEEFGIDHKD